MNEFVAKNGLISLSGIKSVALSGQPDTILIVDNDGNILTSSYTIASITGGGDVSTALLSSISGDLYSLIANTSASNHSELVAVSGSLYSTIVNTSNIITFNEPATDNSAGTQAIFDSAIVGEAVTFPNLLYQKSDGKWWKSDADAAATMPGLRMALETRGIIPATETIFKGSDISHISATMLSATKAITCYQTGGGKGLGEACVVSISGTTITAGTPVVFEGSKYASYESVAMLTDSKAIVCFVDGANSFKGTAQILSVSEMTITAESQFVFKDASTSDTSVAMLTDSKAIVCYKDEGNSSYGTACILSISGTTITAGTPVVFEAAASSRFSVAMLSATKTIVCYQDYDDSSKGKACILSISDTAITTGDVVEFEAGVTTYISVAMLAVDKAIVCYQDDDDDDKGKARILSISGTTITTPEAAVVFEDATTSYISVVMFDTNRAIVCYKDEGNNDYGTACILSVTDATITAETPIVFAAATTNDICVTVIAGGEPVSFYGGPQANDKGLARVLSAGSMADPCSMLVIGRVRDDDWNWTVGGPIYASTDAGGLTQTKPTGAAIAQPVGIAYHADKMIFDPSISITESTLIASSGGSIAISQTGTSFNLEVASAPISNHNSLLGLQGDGVDYFHLNNTQFASISGGIDLSAYTLLTTTNDVSGSLYSTIQDVSGYLQNQITNNYSSLVSASGNLYTIIASTSGVLQSEIDNANIAISTLTGISATIQLTTSIFDIPGIIIPSYIYPADAYTNADYNNLIDLKKKYHDVPLVTILNADSGPGIVEDGNYTAVIKRLNGAGAITIGYIATAYALSGVGQVESYIDGWKNLYPDIQGIFFDEMSNNTSDVSYYSLLTTYAKSQGFNLVVGNPGAGVTQEFFDAKCVDNIMIYESSGYPSEETLKGDYGGGYADYHYHSRSAIAYNVAYNYETLLMMKKYCGLIYATNDTGNPWDTYPPYLEQLFQILAIDDRTVNDNISSLITISGSLQNQITNNYSTLVSVSGNLYSLIASTSAANYSTIASISSSLDGRITTNTNNISYLGSISGDWARKSLDNTFTNSINISGNLSIASIAGTDGNIVTHDDNGKLLDSNVSISSISGMAGIFSDTYFTTGLLPSNLLDPSFDTSSKIVSLSASSGTIDFYIAGQKYQKTSPQTVDISGSWVDNTLFYIYFNSSGILSSMTTPWEINSNNAPVTTVFWNGTSTNAIIGKEFHNATRNLSWHKWAHETIGTRYKSGLDCTFTSSSTTSISGVIEDEDIVVNIPSQTSMMIWYRANQSQITYADTLSNTSAYIIGGALKYDDSSVIKSVQDGYYIRNFIYATNDVNNPLACIVGQSEHNNINDARTTSFPNIPTYISNEIKLLYTVTWKNVGGTPTYVESFDFRTAPTQPNGTLAIRPIIFDELVDVSVPNPGLNEVLAWNGTAWTHVSPKQDALPAGTTTTVLHGNALGSPSYSAVTENDISLSNVSTLNVSTVQHGLTPKLSNDPAQFLNGQGNWTTPSGIANAYISQSFTAAISASVGHNFGAYPIVQVIDLSGAMFIPSSIIHNSLNSFTVNFSTTSSGNILATVGSPQLAELSIVTDNYTTTINDYFIEETSSSKMITLHSPASLPKQRLVITNASTGTMDISGSINGSIQSITLPTTNSLSIYSNFLTWRVY